MYRELLADMEPECDEEDMTVLTVRDNLAEVLSADRQYEEAIRLYETNLEVLLRVADFGDWRVLRLRNEIARKHLDGRGSGRRRRPVDGPGGGLPPLPR